ncbi:MAG: hypothetical protein JNL21_16730 [Myxococcales bacterium]|nr:hypothetical protein [Myxococcales bacterium]
MSAALRVGVAAAFTGLIATFAGVAHAQYPFCADDGVCAFPETCSTCPNDCGSCEVLDLPGQVAKYVDRTCSEAGDGLVDQCAGGPGQPGRFNDLQAALDSLAPGETLFVHPGDYYQPQGPFLIQGMGTADAPIVITAADRNAPPLIHSWDPAAPTNNAASHAALTGAEQPIAHVVIDHLAIDGLLAIHGDGMRVQNVDCTHGWEVCDGNWSCIRLEACNDCVAHHNFVHDVQDSTGHCASSPNAPREAGFKEFDCQRAIWEFNTVVSTAQWGYDLHRSSATPVARFNLFRDAGPVTSIRMNRSSDMMAYGNVVVGGGACVAFIAEDPGNGFTNLVDHNTCLGTGGGIAVEPFSPTVVTNNVVAFLPPSDAESVNLVAPPPEDGVPHTIDFNAYDATSRWVEIQYDGTYYDTLEAWRTATTYDASSIAAPDTPCTFVDVPADPSDDAFDLRMNGGACATASDAASEVGACAFGCVGRACEACGGEPPGSATSSNASTGAGGDATGSGAGAGAGAGEGGANEGGAGGSSEEDGGEEGCSCSTPRPDRRPGALGLALLSLLSVRRRLRSPKTVSPSPHRNPLNSGP